MRYLRYLIPLAAFLVLSGFLFKGLWIDPHTVPSPLIDKPAPGFRLTQVADAGKTVSRDEMLGKVWLLNVWASWCVSCREEHPVLVEFAKSGTVPIYGLDYKDTRAEALKWLDQFGNPYEVSLFDPDGRVGIDYGVYGVPETYVIDKAGTIRYKQIGPITPEVLHEKILPLIRKLNA
ncbi:MAG TPA: DsbE family thiol:disulfide interchange protein [Burkholderiaceae bacterium]|nr:DsbE family thiol:disulfide interchange protein [Burkholderiaceae bacterium]